MNLFLQFSDAAKFADVARNIISGKGFGSDFSFFGSGVFANLKASVFPAIGISPVMPYSIAAFFKIFGVNDFAVIATSFFYFILLLLFTFLLGRKVFKSNLVGSLSAVAVGFNKDVIDYATGGASEAPFMFQIVAATYFLTLKKKWATGVAFLLMVLMYFTRPQGFVYIAGLVLYYLLLNFKPKKAILYFLGISVVGFLIDRFVLSAYHGQYFLYTITGRGLAVANQFVPGVAVSDAIRGGVATTSSALIIFKKIFYNLYNFYKLLPQIINPYLFTFFAVGLFLWSKSKVQNSFKIASVFMFIVTLLVTAASIPFFRYIHPVVPLIYIVAVGTMVGIVGKVTGEWWLVTGVKNGAPITNHKSLVTPSISFLLLFFFAVGQSLGIIFLDSRFEKNTKNVGKPPVYAELSYILRDNTDPNDVVLTNLDTWGSWYGERRTVWFPLEPGQIIDPATGVIPFDAIFLTSYKIDDENYRMGESWKSIFENPEDPTKWVCEGCEVIADTFTFAGVFVIDPDENLEREESKGVLLKKIK
jgi:4-amino-4-deoxy-L-arabinose transferase-like glycosyltransferase